MARKKAADRLNISLGLKDVSDDVRMALYSIQDILHGISVGNLIKAAKIIEAECGDATIEVSDDEYFGRDSNICWSRSETDEEVEKRLVANEKRRVTTAANRKKAKAKKILDEKATLRRLKIRYPNEDQ